VTAVDSPFAAALAGRYALERELGQGGMATVYLAQDLRHKRPVALKVLHPDLAAALGPARFQREIETAARLQHPHILTVHDSGEAAGRLWFTMPYVEGESLRDRLRREKQLPVDEALRITRDAAQALAYAHRHGVVHRDVKPENLLLTEDGNTLVADFGVARALQGGEDALTQTGLAVGTPAYMSPEQAMGEREITAKSDVYSLATVLYEMLAGEPPFAGPTAQAAVARRFTETPRPLRQLRETVPEAVEQAVLRALAKVPADRFPTAAEFARALVASPPIRRRAVPAAALTLILGVLVGLGALFAWRRSHPRADAADGPTRLAVLPFENLGGPEDEYFADGVTDEVRGKLAALPGLEVIARTSSSEYKRTPKRPSEVGQELGVRYLLTGTVRWERAAAGQGRVRVSPELVEVGGAGPPVTRWQQPFDAVLSDVFEVQGTIAEQVAGALLLTLGAGARERLAARPTENLAAYDAYLQARAAPGTPTGYERAVAAYRRAIALDSGFVLAWVGLAEAHAGAYAIYTTARAGAAARLAVERAAALAPTLAAVHRALGRIGLDVDWDERQGLAEFEKGLAVAPNDAELLTGAADAAWPMGRFDEAIDRFRRALVLDPRSAETSTRMAKALLWRRRFPEALAAFRRARELNPQASPYREALAAAATGDLAGARATLSLAASDEELAGVAGNMTGYGDEWLFSEAQQRRLLALTPEAFAGDRALWAIVQAETHWVRGDSLGARTYADSALAVYGRELAAGERAEDMIFRWSRAWLRALAGNPGEAARELEALGRGIDSEFMFQRVIVEELLARTSLMAGRREQALARVGSLVASPGYFTAAWFRVAPAYAPLRGDPRFQRLVNGP
jgi:serine/threonine-protein kinase